MQKLNKYFVVFLLFGICILSCKKNKDDKKTDAVMQQKESITLSEKNNAKSQRDSLRDLMNNALKAIDNKAEENGRGKSKVSNEARHYKQRSWSDIKIAIDQLLLGKPVDSTFFNDYPKRRKDLEVNVTAEKAVTVQMTPTMHPYLTIKHLEEAEQVLKNYLPEDIEANTYISPKFKSTLKEKIESLKNDRRYTEITAKRVKDAFFKLNPDLYFGESSGGVYFPSGSRTNALFLPLGKLSFADEVVQAQHPNNTGNPEKALHEPDYYAYETSPVLLNNYSLGLKGSLTVKFTDNALVDVNGPDLYVFESGAVEPTMLEISTDGMEWIDVGKIDGGTAEVDISSFVAPNTLFYYLRLTDLDTRSGIPGADIDAIAAIGAAMRLELDSKVLFETGKSELKPEGVESIKTLAKSVEVLEKGKVIIEGHTDDVGNDSSNKSLSLARAKSVSKTLKELLGNNFSFEEKGWGESKPAVPNNSEENRAKNRRVEVLVLPK